MQLIFLGAGAAFTIDADNYQSNLLLTDGRGKNLLLDCGTDARLSLAKLGYSYKDITDVYISHLHGDHCGGLQWLGYTTKFDTDCSKPNLYINNTLAEDLWSKVLAGCMDTIDEQAVNLNSYFNVQAIGDENQFIWENISFKLVQTVHVANGYTMLPSYGLFFSINGIKIFFTTDTQFCPYVMMEYYQKADFIFHDCETKKERSSVHANYQELKTLDKAIKSKMWLYHYNPGPLPNAEKDGFRGFIKGRQVFDFNNRDSFLTTIIADSIS